MDDNYESVNAEGSAELEKMPKPMAVRIVEDLAWMYVGLALSMTVFATVRAILDPHASAKFVWPIGLPFVLLTLAMQWALRRGRSSWFILPHYVFWLALACPSLLLSLFRARAMDLVLFFRLTTALVVVTWLLLLSDSRKWCADVRARLTKLLKIDRSLNREGLVASERLWIESDGSRVKFAAAPRIGIAYASKRGQSRKWRFTLCRDM